MKLNTYYKSVSAIAVCTALAVTPASLVSALAQETGDQTAADSDDAVTTYNTIVVTARKREESLQDVPVVATVFDAASLERYNLNRMEDIAGLTPGLTIGEAASQAGGVIALRGVSTGTANPAFDQAVSIVLDGVSMSHASILRFSQFDGAGIEVLKGPQALFFGKNSPGGIISYKSANPTDEFYASLRAGHEFEANENYGEVVVSGPISETVGGRLVVYYRDVEGWFDRVVADIPGFTVQPLSDRGPGSEELFARGTLQFEPNDNFNMVTKLNYGETDGDSYFSNNQRVFCPLGFSQSVPTDDCEADGTFSYGDLIDAITAIDPNANGNGRNRGESDMTLLTNEANLDLTKDLTLTSVTGFLDWSDAQIGSFAPGTSLGIFGGSSLQSQNVYTQEVRLTSDSDNPVNFLVGAFYSSAEFSSEVNVGVFNPLVGAIPLNPPSPIYDLDTEAYSVFGQLIWDVNDQLEIAGGLRWSEEEKEFTATEAGVPVTNIAPADRKFDDISPEATITWRPTDNQTYFASYKEGFKSGGYNITFVPGGISAIAPATLDQSYEQENVEGFELGAKWLLLGGDLRLNAAAYQYEYSDLQLSSFEPSTLALRVQNAGAATVEGFEFDATYAPSEIDGLLLRLGASFNDATYDEFISPCYAGQTPAQGCNFVIGTDPISMAPILGQDLAGAPLSIAPEVNLAGGVTYEKPIMPGYTISTSVDLEYSSDYVFQQEQNPGAVQDDFTRLNANISLFADKGWEVSLIGRNLTDEYVKTLGGEDGLAVTTPVDISSSVSRGRQVTLQFKVTSDLLK